jgi:hypothetical protein
LKVKVYGSKLWYVLDRDSCLPGWELLHLIEGSCGSIW